MRRKFTSGPIRCLCFIESKNWLICGTDDLCILTVDLTTFSILEKKTTLDYPRCISVHPKKPLFIHSGDDLTSIIYNWETKETSTIVKHCHYILASEFDPLDDEYFYTASLDQTIRRQYFKNPEEEEKKFTFTSGINSLRALKNGKLIFGSDSM